MQEYKHDVTLEFTIFLILTLMFTGTIIKCSIDRDWASVIVMSLMGFPISCLTVVFGLVKFSK